MSERHYECVNCPFFTSTQIWDGTHLELTPFCSYNGEQALYCGNCDREPTYLDDENEETEADDG